MSVHAMPAAGAACGKDELMAQYNNNETLVNSLPAADPTDE